MFQSKEHEAMSESNNHEAMPGSEDRRDSNGDSAKAKTSEDATLRDEERRDEEKGLPRFESNTTNDPFGDETNAKIKYKTMKWWQASMIMIAETVSLGILSLPSVLATVGFVPGMIMIAGLGMLATYTGYVLGQFKMKYTHVHSMADVGEILLAPLGMATIGREVFGAAQILFLVFVMGSHVLTFSIMMNTVTGHGACSIVFGIVGMIVCMICALPRKLGDVSWMAIVSFISIIGAILITMVGVGIERPGHNIIDATMHNSFYQSFEATTNIVFAYAGHVAFFSFISELKNPEEYPKALFLLQGCDTTLYLLVAGVVYAYAGNEVASPAFGSTTGVLQKAAYGVAIPTIVVAGVINGHVAAKYIYVRMFRGTNVMQERSLKSYGSWGLITVGLWVVAWFIAEVIPTFNDLLSLISALFASWFTYGLAGVFWLFLNKGRYTENKKKMALTALNCVCVLIGAVLMVLGLYASGTAIKQHASTSGSPFSCEDNSGPS